LNTESEHLPEDHCPTCNHLIDARTLVCSSKETTPDPDVENLSLSVCAYCSSYLVFGEDLKVRILDVDELLKLPNDILLSLTRIRNATKGLIKIKAKLEKDKEKNRKQLEELQRKREKRDGQTP
jgi:hypothetical protein